MENKIKSIIIATLLLIMPSISFAGIVKGKIIEQGTNEPLTGATILTNDGQGTSADIDGNYSLILKNGTYTLTVRFIGFKTMIKEDVKVTGDELIIDFVLEPYDIKRMSQSTHETYFYSATRFGDMIVRAAVP